MYSDIVCPFCVQIDLPRAAQAVKTIINCEEWQCRIGGSRYQLNELHDRLLLCICHENAMPQHWFNDVVKRVLADCRIRTTAQIGCTSNPPNLACRDRRLRGAFPMSSCHRRSPKSKRRSGPLALHLRLRHGATGFSHSTEDWDGHRGGGQGIEDIAGWISS